MHDRPSRDRLGPSTALCLLPGRTYSLSAYPPEEEASDVTVQVSLRSYDRAGNLVLESSAQASTYLGGPAFFELSEAGARALEQPYATAAGAAGGPAGKAAR